MRSSLLILMLMINTLVYANSNFGRLFTTQDQRAFLDHLRTATPEDTPTETATPETTRTNAPEMVSSEQPENAITTESVKLSGVIIRHDGKTTVWSNNRLIYSDDQKNEFLQSNPLKEQPGKVHVQANDLEMTFKTGQTWFLNSNEVKEHYEIQQKDHSKRIAETQKPDKTEDIKSVDGTTGIPDAELESMILESLILEKISKP